MSKSDRAARREAQLDKYPGALAITMIGVSVLFIVGPGIRLIANAHRPWATVWGVAAVLFGLWLVSVWVRAARRNRWTMWQSPLKARAIQPSGGPVEPLDK